MLGALLITLAVPADPADLVRALGDREFAVREHAEAALGRRLESGGLVAEAAGSTSPEVSRRAVRILAAHRARRAALVMAELDREYPVWPYLDSLCWSPARRGYVPDSLAGALVYPELHRFVGPAAAYSDERFPQFRTATRAFVWSLVRDGADPGAIRDLLADMWARELDYCRFNGLVYRGPGLSP